MSLLVSAIGAKKLEIVFNKNAEGAEISLKKGTVAVNVDKVEFAEDGKSVVVTTTAKLTKGDYTATVDKLEATVTVEDEKVAKINVAPKAPRKPSPDANEAIVSYEVLNQYGEKVTPSGITWTVSTGETATPVGNDKLTIKNAGTNDFIPGAKVYITGVHATSGTVVNAEVEVVLESKADTVEFKGVYDTNKDELVNLPAGFTNGRYVLLVEVNDQYGNKIDSPAMGEIVFTSSNPAFVSSTFTVGTDVTIDDVTYKSIALVQGTMPEKGGKVTIQGISTVTGSTSSFEIDASALAEVKTFAMSAPEKMVAEGEKVEIPFTAVDQYGEDVTDYDLLDNGVTLSPTANLKFVRQNDGSAKLEFTAPTGVATENADYPVYLTSLVTQGGDFSSLMISVKVKAEATTIAGLNSKISQSIAVGNSVSFKLEHINILDQYGRVMTKTQKENWLTGDNVIVVKSEFDNTTDKSPFTVIYDSGSDAETSNIGEADKSVVVAAKTDSGLNKTEKIELALSTDNGTSTIEASAKSITFTVVEQSAYTSYEVEDLGTMYNNSSLDGGNDAIDTDGAYNKTVKVYGVLANGTKVLLPKEDYEVTTNGKLTVTENVISDEETAQYVDADFKDNSGNAKNITLNVLVTVNEKSSGAAAAILEKELIVSNAAPKVATITLDEDEVTDGKAVLNPAIKAIDADLLKSVIDEVKDQYGVDNAENPTITITNLVKTEGSDFKVTDNGTATTAIGDAKMGDKFTATFKYASGESITVEFTVGLPQ